jgi:hypothetical protein
MMSNRGNFDAIKKIEVTCNLTSYRWLSSYKEQQNTDEVNEAL